jgi:DNA (cytosine-5)-methyltransferase 1
MKFGSLFSGIGGFDLGFERAGMICAWQVEIEPNCQKLLSSRFPNAKRYADVKKVGKENLEPVDVICGGFPCQDVSVAGNRAGLAGERSGLWFEFHRIIAETKPRFVVIENVPGLLSSNKGRDFAVILRGLVKCGYGVCWRILDARYFGVAQRRRRVFIVASLGNGSCTQVLFERESVSRDSEQIGKEGQAFAFSAGQGAKAGSIGYAREESPTLKGGEGGNRVPSVMVAPTLYASGAGTDRTASAGNEAEFCIPVSKPLSSKNQRNDFETENLVVFNIQHNDGGEHRRKDRPNGGMYVQETETALTVGSTDLTAIAYNRTGSTTARDNPSSEITPSLKAQEHIAVGIRRLTPIECERLQGFPDDWTDVFADSVRYRMLGNAVCVNAAEWIAKRIMTIDK